MPGGSWTTGYLFYVYSLALNNNIPLPSLVQRVIKLMAFTITSCR